MSEKNQDLLGKHYIDPHDSGDLVMEVVGFGPLPNDVLVKPVDIDRVWPRDAKAVRGLVARYDIEEKTKGKS